MSDQLDDRPTGGAPAPAGGDRPGGPGGPDVPADTGDAGDARSDEPAATGRRGRPRTGLIVSLVVALLLAGFVAVLATREPATDRRASSPLIGRVAPPLAGETLDGEAFDIDDHRGRWVVVNFFATWCVPCVQEHPELVAFDEAHRRRGDAVLVSVLYSDDADTAQRFFERHGGEWPVVLDPTARIASVYGVPKVPETYIVAPSGRVVDKRVGGVTREGLDSVIQSFEAAAREAS